MPAVPIEQPLPSFTAYARYRAAGGLILTVVERTTQDDPGTVVLLVVLDRGGWQDASLLPSEMPGFTMGTNLATYGYMRHSDSFTLPENNGGWTRCDTPPGVLGRGAPAPGDNPLWHLPVVRLTAGAFHERACYCGGRGEGEPQRSYCDLCTPERQEAAYLYAVQPPKRPGGLSSLTGRP